MRCFSGVFVLYFLLMLSNAVYAQTTISTALPSLQFDWYIPALRENGSTLSLADIGGYELRCRIKGTTQFKSFVIRGASYRTYFLNGLASGVYECQIATFDADGLHSIFVPIQYKLVLPIAKPPSNPTSNPSTTAIVPVRR